MRRILVDRIIQMQHYLKMCQETLYLAAGILNKFLHRRDVDTDKFQLVGVTALLEITRMERTLLSVFEFEVSHGIDFYFILYRL